MNPRSSKGTSYPQGVGRLGERPKLEVSQDEKIPGGDLQRGKSGARRPGLGAGQLGEPRGSDGEGLGGGGPIRRSKPGLSGEPRNEGDLTLHPSTRGIAHVDTKREKNGLAREGRGA